MDICARDLMDISAGSNEHVQGICMVTVGMRTMNLVVTISNHILTF